ncbi:MAG: glycoside hydrolase family 25 protein [Prevotella sp.]|nr:glycoside hydrolase family 25 protein [Prevotella sp.]
MLNRLPGWTVWIGGLIMVVFCFVVFNAIFSTTVTDIYFPPGYQVHGIDVSHHQGNIDWQVLRSKGSINGQPVSFAFIKATEGDTYVDPMFQRNFNSAREQGIMRGAYHFFRPSVPAEKQADLFISQVKLQAGDLPPVLDVEVPPFAIETDTLRHAILKWMERVGKHYGVTPILYTYYYYRKQYLSHADFARYPLWIARYGSDSLIRKGPWAFWQHSDKGQVEGIKGYVDLNIFNGSPDELQRFTVIP